MELNTTQLIEQVGVWAGNNFLYIAPEWGVVEEIGEACHCILKYRQKIRGYESEAKFLANFKDALADTMIFLSNYAYCHGSFFAFKRNTFSPQALLNEEHIIVTHVLQGATSLFNHGHAVGEEKTPATISVSNLLCQRLCTALEYWANLYEIDLEKVTFETWEKVCKRDWKKDPRNAGN